MLTSNIYIYSSGCPRPKRRLDSTVPRPSDILTKNVFSRPSGSEQNIPTTGLPEAAKSTNPDHVGGYQAALPIISGMESKFGLSLPKNTAVA